MDPKVIHKKEGDSVLHTIAAFTTWNNYLYIAEKYFADQEPPLDNTESPPVVCAINYGRFYFTQQYFKKYNIDAFLSEYAEEVIEIAKEHKYPYLLKWMKKAVAAFLPTEGTNLDVEVSLPSANNGTGSLY